MLQDGADNIHVAAQNTDIKDDHIQVAFLDYTNSIIGGCSLTHNPDVWLSPQGQGHPIPIERLLFDDGDANLFLHWSPPVPIRICQCCRDKYLFTSCC